ncbi:unnamed protein product, partial [Symbiodinium sp. KB8]
AALGSVVQRLDLPSGRGGSPSRSAVPHGRPVGQALVDGGQSRAAKLDDASRLLHRGRRLLGPWAGQPLYIHAGASGFAGGIHVPARAQTDHALARGGLFREPFRHHRIRGFCEFPADSFGSDGQPSWSISSATAAHKLRGGSAGRLSGLLSIG